MKSIFLFVFVTIYVANAQRPSYAGIGPIGRPGLASRFQDPNATTEATTVDVNNRIGEGTTEKIPVDALGDYELVHRLNQWPREHRPFWLLNAQHIEASRNKPPVGTTSTLNQRGNFGSEGVIPVKPNPGRSPFLRPIDNDDDDDDDD